MHRHGKRTVMLVGLSMLLGSAGLPAPVTAAQVATPTADCPATTPAENLAVVRSFFEEGMNGADLSVFDRVAAPDIVYYGATVGDESALDALKRIYGEALTGFPVSSTPSSPRSRMAMPSHFATCRGRAHRGFPGTGADRHHHLESRIRARCMRANHRDVGRDRSARPAAEFGILAAEGPATRMAGAASRPAATPMMPAESASCAPQSPEETIAVVDRVRAEVYNTGNFDVMPRSLPRGTCTGRRTARTRSGSPKGRGGSGFRDRTARPGMDLRRGHRRGRSGRRALDDAGNA